MRASILALLCLFFAMPVVAQDKPFSVALAADQVDITTGFTGTQINIFGTKPPDVTPLVVVEGPRKDLVLRRKKKIFGIWMNAESLKFRNVPAFYDWAGDPDVVGELNPDLRKDNEIGIAYLNIVPRLRGASAEEAAFFRKALFKLKREKGLYLETPKEIREMTQHFFRTDFALPATIPSGSYTIKAYGLRDGAVAFEDSLIFTVGQAGTSATVLEYAENKPFIYGLFGIFMAAFMGWGATQILRRD